MIRDKLIQNTKLHTRTAVIVSSFGDDGSAHLTPVEGDKPGRPFILDAYAAKELGATLTLIADQGIGRAFIAESTSS